MSVTIRALSEPNLSEVLRRADVTLTAREAKIIDYCHSMSETTWVGYNGGKLICAWGIIPPSLLSQEVYLWLHTTEAVNTSQFLFVRHSQLFVRRLLREYSAVVGHVRVDAAGSRKWLKWLGATFSPARNGFLNFRIEKHG